MTDEDELAPDVAADLAAGVPVRVDDIAADTDEIERLQRSLAAARRRRQLRIRAYLAAPEHRAADLVRAVGRTPTQITRIASGQTSGRKYVARGRSARGDLAD